MNHSSTTAKPTAVAGRPLDQALDEHDACGLVAVIGRDQQPSHLPLEQALDALTKMQHRAGMVDGEGDGTGVLCDLPRGLWAKRLRSVGQPERIAWDPHFVVGHFFLPKEASRQRQEALVRLLKKGGLTLLWAKEGTTVRDALGPAGQREEPCFFQVAGRWADDRAEKSSLAQQLFALEIAAEQQLGVHVVSLSESTVAYKLRGSAEILPHYYPELIDPDFAVRAVIGHNRYSTNTASSFVRVQPFTMVAHNGEINTIQKLREEAAALGVPLTPHGSDSQDLDRVLRWLIAQLNYAPQEALGLLFPPIVNEVRKRPPHLQRLFMYARAAFGPFAQGPAAIVARFGDTLLFSVDALGLRPLWQMQTPDLIFVSSEPGVVPVSAMIDDPEPLAPGERRMIQLTPQGPVLYDEAAFEADLYQQACSHLPVETYAPEMAYALPPRQEEEVPAPLDELAERRAMAAEGWSKDDVSLVEAMAQLGQDPIRSLGYDGPLAVLSQDRENIADFLKETVAVVTNPAIDREREIEHFSTRILFGPRPTLTGEVPDGLLLQARTPIVLGGGPQPVLSWQVLRAIAEEKGLFLLPDLQELFGDRCVVVRLLRQAGEPLQEAIAALQERVVEAVQEGAQLIILRAWMDGSDDCFFDPALAVSAVDLALRRATPDARFGNLRRLCSVVIESGAIRNLHDFMVMKGLGADGIAPFRMERVACAKYGEAGVRRWVDAMTKGAEKVISTIGLHELRGYARLFSGIGLSPQIAELLDVPNFFGSETASYGFADCEAEAAVRAQLLSQERPPLGNTFTFFPRIWKQALDVATGQQPYAAYDEKLQQLEEEHPIALRHLLRQRSDPSRPALSPQEVDLTTGEHAYPFVIPSMSFGSQGEIAFRAYAEAAKQLNVIALNGEGGEIKDMYGRYRKHRGLQVASGRFGVNVEMLNAADLLEIKIGQGAKPGEGGHLPAKKVSRKVADARNAQPGTDLISPSNNHDIYSIEDLAQMVHELKAANPHARVSVKVPVVPGIGTIAVGIAKSGADIINLSGYDGGTGAARVHAVRYVGLPAEIGLYEAHRALIAAGLRDRVELWADGGMKSARDVVKMMLMGANRVGFGTLAMVAIGCTACRGCQLDTCHVGITTQIESVEEARQKGLKKFTPQSLPRAVEQLVTFFGALGEEVRRLVAELGFRRAQELVGHAELLEQFAGQQRIDLRPLLQPVPGFEGVSWAHVGKRNEISFGPQELSKWLAAQAQHAWEEELNEALAQVVGGSGRIVAGTSTPRFSVELHNLSSAERMLGTTLSAAVARAEQACEAEVTFHETIAGQGFGSYNGEGVSLRVEGGAQDGVAKGAVGGSVVVLKSVGADDRFHGGAVGKSFAYGAQRGRFFVQGKADSRAAIRLSGADVVLGERLTHPIDQGGSIGAAASVKGFAFEYMTNGRAVVLGDPGPWICSGMTGGVVYLHLQPELGLDESALRQRIAKGAKVVLQPLSEQGVQDLEELLTTYAEELVRSGQTDEASWVLNELHHATERFCALVPQSGQTDQSISTE
ncbi:MAG: glutamate synthase [Firmicutes bacterium]|nr:glutamate synthase [Bacillota bacterium]